MKTRENKFWSMRTAWDFELQKYSKFKPVWTYVEYGLQNTFTYNCLYVHMQHIYIYVLKYILSLKCEFTLNVFCRFGCGICGYDRFFFPTPKAQKQQSY